MTARGRVFSIHSARWTAPQSNQGGGLIDCNNHTDIPNHNLEYRDYKQCAAATGLSIQDANVVRIQVADTYQLKVPLMRDRFIRNRADTNPA
jgi:hypothetical protein